MLQFIISIGPILVCIYLAWMLFYAGLKKSYAERQQLIAEHTLNLCLKILTDFLRIKAGEDIEEYLVRVDIVLKLVVKENYELHKKENERKETLIINRLKLEKDLSNLINTSVNIR